MSDFLTGPVSVGEVQAIVDQLRVLTARSADCGQQMFHFVLSMAAESLEDNIEQAADMEDDE